MSFTLKRAERSGRIYTYIETLTTLVGPFVGEVEGDVEGDNVSGGPLITSSQTPLALHNPEQHSALSLHVSVLDAVHAHTNALFKLHPVAAVQRSRISSPVHNLPPVFEVF